MANSLAQVGEDPIQLTYGLSCIRLAFTRIRILEYPKELEDVRYLWTTEKFPPEDKKRCINSPVITV
jgi:hypothetical protein